MKYVIYSKEREETKCCFFSHWYIGIYWYPLSLNTLGSNLENRADPKPSVNCYRYICRWRSCSGIRGGSTWEMFLWLARKLFLISSCWTLLQKAVEGSSRADQLLWWDLTSTCYTLKTFINDHKGNIVSITSKCNLPRKHYILYYMCFVLHRIPE